MSLEQLLESIPPGSADEMLARQVNFDQLPAHIAIIMDGNGRWAAQRHLPRVEGHRAGIDSVRDVVETSARLGIDVLTLYAFSVENWKRPRAEVNTLMMLLKRYIRLELGTLQENNIKFRVIGRAEELSPDVQHELEIGILKTAKNTGMQFNIALNYGGRAEIVDAARRAIVSGIAPDDLDERRFSEFLYTAGQPDPDLQALFEQLHGISYTQAVENDSADVGVIHVVDVGQRNAVGPEAREVRAKIATP
jgi:undecaprenyl diphosphate synthase